MAGPSAACGWGEGQRSVNGMRACRAAQSLAAAARLPSRANSASIADVAACCGVGANVPHAASTSGPRWLAAAM